MNNVGSEPEFVIKNLHGVLKDYVYEGSICSVQMVTCQNGGILYFEEHILIKVAM